MLSLLVEQQREQQRQEGSEKEFFENLDKNCAFLLSARPTAINLANAFEELREFAQRKLVGRHLSVAKLKSLFVPLNYSVMYYFGILPSALGSVNLCSIGRLGSVRKMTCWYGTRFMPSLVLFSSGEQKRTRSMMERS
jgi:hypothetical protein